MAAARPASASSSIAFVRIGTPSRFRATLAVSLRGFRIRDGLGVGRPRKLVPVSEQMAVGLGAVSTRDRNIELRIAPHPVLGDVEPRGLHVRLDADAPQL